MLSNPEPCEPAAAEPAAPSPPLPAFLRCLGPPRLEVLGEAIDLKARLATPAVELLLRVAAAGPRGAALAPLEAALWPRSSPRARRTRLNEALRGLAVLLARPHAPLAIEGARIHVVVSRLRVDSIDLELALAPLLVPFTSTSRPVADAARSALAGALSRPCAFLPGLQEAWAISARLRIADALARAARRLSS